MEKHRRGRPASAPTSGLTICQPKGWFLIMTTILQIEDNQANRILVERVLTPHGHLLIQAATGELGIELAIERRPDLILIDIGLPDYDGHTVLSLLQQIPELAHVPFVAITAWPADIAREMCERYGYDGCITKPIDIKTFPALIHKFLQLKKDGLGRIDVE